MCAMVSAASLVVRVPEMADAATPYAQSQSERLQIGLLNGKIRPCPLDINPNCVSTSSSNQAYAFPWEIPASDSSSAVKKIESAILGTQKNAQIVKVEDVSDGKRNGKYVVAEVDGFLGRDTLEFLVRDDVVTYRSMANKVQYVYPFTTPLGDFGAQQKHIQTLGDELGWLLPDFDTTR